MFILVRNRLRDSVELWYQHGIFPVSNQLSSNMATTVVADVIKATVFNPLATVGR